jgi:hypothetical protein
MFFAGMTLNYQKCKLYREYESTLFPHARLHNEKLNKSTHRLRAQRKAKHETYTLSSVLRVIASNLHLTNAISLTRSKRR